MALGAQKTSSEMFSKAFDLSASESRASGENDGRKGLPTTLALDAALAESTLSKPTESVAHAEEPSCGKGSVANYGL